MAEVIRELNDLSLAGAVVACVAIWGLVEVIKHVFARF